jgi:hypothetical protein
MLERGRAGVGVCGETLSHCLGDDWDNEKIIWNESRRGLRQLPDEETHNNQPEIDGPGGGDIGEEIQLGVIAWEM